MRWRGRRQSDQVEDRRGRPAGRRTGRRVATGGIGTIVVVLVVAYLTGTDPMALLSSLEQAQVSVEPGPAAPPPATGGTASRPDDPMADFVAVVLADTEDTWREIFAAQGRRYELPRLVLFDDAVSSACGFNSAAVGPFYCPADDQVYVDLAFFGDLDRRFGAPGDFAQAYVIAHEVGHHVQNLLGISSQVQSERSRLPRSRANELSVRLELQADCLAGIWGHHAGSQHGFLEPGDLEEGMAAAAAIGDDRLQRRAGGRVQPESWTHGSSEQRISWFRRGLESGELASCDTFQGAL